jgi:hypothetical protein
VIWERDEGVRRLADDKEKCSEKGGRGSEIVGRRFMTTLSSNNGDPRHVSEVLTHDVTAAA